MPALDGVRAIAIGLVLLFHGGVRWASGGFIGVDVFFALSGFLITSLLLAEYRETSGLGVLRFWGRRARRLLPALLAMLLAVACYAAFLASADTLDQVRGDALATLFYVANWHQLAGGTGYFAALSTPDPLLHTWSLAIEEQFYIVWPLVVLLVLRATRSFRALLAVCVVGAAASATAMALLYDPASLSRAYYGTDTRAQGLLIGAMLAVLMARPLRRRERRARRRPGSLIGSIALPGWARGALTVGGGLALAFLGWFTVTVTGASAWPYDGGFAAVAGATTVLVACVSMVPRSPWAVVLSVRPVRYVGRISYGLYLWHWPIFLVLDTARTGLTGWTLFAVRVAVAFAVSVLSFHLLELPIRRHGLRGWWAWTIPPLAVAGTACALVAATAGAIPSLSAQGATLPAGTPHTDGSLTRLDPGTSPNVPAVPAGTGGPVRVLLVGDSEASFLGFGLGPSSARYGVSFADDGVIGCGLQQGTTVLRGQLETDLRGIRGADTFVPCANQDVRWRADLTSFHPDVVLLADGEFEVRDRLIDGHLTHIGQPDFDRREQQAIDQAAAVLRSTGADVVLLSAPYYRQPAQLDGQPWPEDDPARVRRYNAMLAAAARPPGVVVADLNARLDPSGQYQQVVDGVDVRFSDGIHVDPAGGRLVAPWLLSLARTLGLADRAVPTSGTAPTAAHP